MKGGTYHVLSDSEINSIDDGFLRILSQVGMRVSVKKSLAIPKLGDLKLKKLKKLPSDAEAFSSTSFRFN